LVIEHIQPGQIDELHLEKTRSDSGIES